MYMFVYIHISLIEELFSDDGGVEVDESLQEDFFKRVDSQLQSINEFFQFEESRLQYSLSEMNKKVAHTHTAYCAISHTPPIVLFLIECYSV